MIGSIPMNLHYRNKSKDQIITLTSRESTISPQLSKVKPSLIERLGQGFINVGFNSSSTKLVPEVEKEETEKKPKEFFITKENEFNLEKLSNEIELC